MPYTDSYVIKNVQLRGNKAGDLAEMDVLSDMGTYSAAKTIGLENFEIAEGNQAYLVIHNHQIILNLIRYHEIPKHVISHGNLI